MVRNFCLFATIAIFVAGGCGPSQQEKARVAAGKNIEAERLFADKEFAQALALTRESMELNGEVASDTSLSDNYVLMARCLRELGEYDSALVAFQSAIQYFHSVSDQHLERRARIALAEFYYEMNDNGNAAALSSDAAMAAKVFSNIDDRYSALAIAARAYHRLGRYKQELQTLDALAEIDNQTFAGRDNFALLQARLNSYNAAGQPAQAREVFSSWKLSAASKGDSIGILAAYYAWGECQLSMGKPDSAQRLFSYALEKFSNRGTPLLHIQLLNAMGNLSYRSRQFENARTYFADALQIARSSHLTGFDEMLQLALVSCDDKLNNMKSATVVSDLIKKSSSIADECKKLGLRIGEALGEFLKAQLEAENKAPDAAVSDYRNALQTFEQTTDVAKKDPLISNLEWIDGGTTRWYDALSEIYCSAGNAENAFGILERKNLRDLTSFFSGMTLQTADAALNRKVSVLQWNFNALRLLEEDILGELADGNRKSSVRLETLSGLYSQRLARIEAAAADLGNSNFAQLLSPHPLSLKGLRDTLFPGAVVVEYAPLASGVYALVIKREAAYVKKTSASTPNLLSSVDEYSRLMGETHVTSSGIPVNQASSTGRINQLSTVLYNGLISPIQPDLRGATNLYVVPPEEFGWMAFHALKGDGSSLIERVNVSYLPTASALTFARPRERFVRKVVGLGYPGTTGWDVEYELKDIRGFYDRATLLFDTSTTLRHLLDSTYDVLHIAAEFHLDRDIPMNSGVVLADGLTPFGMRTVSLGEFLSVPAPQSLVFSNISAIPGEFYRYAPLILLANGTETVIATMWQGDRRAKKHFGEGFYTGLLGEVAPSESYHRALIGMMKRDEYASPQRWALYYQFGR